MRLAALIICLPFAALAQAPDPNDVVMKAMRDELARSMKKLQLENLEKPYFISYSVYDSDQVSTSASFGSLNHPAERQRGRAVQVRVRVGNYDLDNGNFLAYSYGGNGVSRYGAFAYLPVEDNYDEIRRQLWLATDSAYKKALEDISKKRALLANKNRTEVIPDFSKEAPAVVMDTLPRVDTDPRDLENMVRELSAVLKEFPAISSS